MEEWKKFRDVVMECTDDICGMRRVGGREERGVNGGMKKWVGQWPKRAFEEWLQRRDRVTYDRYRAQRVVVKHSPSSKKNDGPEMVRAIGE